MQISFWIFGLVSLVELALFVLLLVFFARLRRSEELLLTLQQGQSKLMLSLAQNEELEKELVASFSQRQSELQALDQRLEERAAKLQKLLDQADKISRSPQFLREVILAGARRGKTPAQLAKGAGLSLDEVELILAEAGH